jgi:anthranilate synthase component 2
MKIVVIDNYDSFVYNLVHYLEDLNCEVTVKRNNEFLMNDVSSFDKIVLSPGPGIPDEAGNLKELIRRYAASKPILGVCLGQQAIAEVFGATLINLNHVFHGEATKAFVLVDDEPIFKDIGKELEIGRYHSWGVSRDNFPETLTITSVDENNQIMSLRHNSYDVCGVQFHPESILTPLGKQLLKNWIES